MVEIKTHFKKKEFNILEKSKNAVPAVFPLGKNNVRLSKHYP